MPCTYDGPNPSYKEELDKVTNYLCAMCYWLEEYHNEIWIRALNYDTSGLSEWWAAHKEADERRRKSKENLEAGMDTESLIEIWRRQQLAEKLNEGWAIKYAKDVGEMLAEIKRLKALLERTVKK